MNNMNLFQYTITCGIFKTLKKLNLDPKWHEAKRKTNIIIKKTLIIYIPFILLIPIMISTGNKLISSLSIIILGLIFLSIPIYVNKILKPMIDNWYKVKN